MVLERKGFKDGQRFQTVYYEVSNHWLVDDRLCGCPGHFLHVCCNTWKTAFWLRAGIWNYLAIAYYANTLPSGGIVWQTFRTSLCQSYAMLAKPGFFFIFYFYTYKARFPRVLCAAPCMRRGDWPLKEDSLVNDSSICAAFVDVS